MTTEQNVPNTNEALTMAPGPPQPQGPANEILQPTTGYEPNIRVEPALPRLGLPPSDIVAQGPDAMLQWYMSQHEALDNPPVQPRADVSRVTQPPGLSQGPGGAQLALPFQGYWGEVLGARGVDVQGISPAYATPSQPYPFTEPAYNTGLQVTPSFAFPMQSQHLGQASVPQGSLFSGVQQPQQSLLSSLANMAQTGVSSALNPLLAAMNPPPPVQLIPNMPPQNYQQNYNKHTNMVQI